MKAGAWNGSRFYCLTTVPAVMQNYSSRKQKENRIMLSCRSVLIMMMPMLMRRMGT